MDYSNLLKPIIEALSWIGLGVAAISVGLGFDAAREAYTHNLPEFDPSTVGASEEESTEKTLNDYQIIVERRIFGFTETEKEESDTDTTSNNKELRLVATNATGTPFAIIESKKDKEQEIFKTGQSVFGAGTLNSINPLFVVLNRNGSEEKLFISSDEGSKLKKSGKGVGSSIASNDDQTEFEVEQEDVDNALADLPTLLSQARAVPYFRNGKSIGMRLFAIRQGSLYDKLGLKNGDIIRKVNGENVSDPTQALQVFNLLKDDKSINVTVERRGGEQTLNYNIR